MADIDIKQPAKINRNTAADGDFLWEKDFKVLYENDEKLKNAIQQASQDYSAGDGIDINPTTKTISVKTGTGIEKTEEGLSVNIEGVDGAKVELQGNTFKVSAYNSESDIKGLNVNLAELQDEVFDFERYAEEKYITSGNEMVPNHQYVYTTSGWADIGGEHATVSYWRPTYNESTGKLSWQMSPSIEAPADALVKGDKGNDGQTPEFQINKNTNFWEWKYTNESQSEWRSTNTSATGPQGATGETGAQGFSIDLATVETVPGGKEITLKWGDPESPSTSAFVIPSGDKGGKGDPGEPGDDGYTPSVSADDITDINGRGKKVTFYWPEGPAGKSDTEFNIYHGYSPTMALRAVTDPQGQHTEGGIEFTINYLDKSTSAIGTIWNGNNGTAVVNCDGRWITGNGTAGENIRPTQETLDILQSVSGKVAIPEYSSPNTYQIWNAQTSAWNSIDTWWNVAGSSVVKYDNLDTVIIPQNGLSAHWNSSNTELKFGLSAEYETAIKDVSNKVDKSGDQMTGELVLSGSNYDDYYLKVVRQNVNGHARFGLGGSGGAVIKAVDGTNNAQMLVKSNATSGIEILLQKNSNEYIGNLIPMVVEQAGWTPPATNDYKLHIVLES